MQRFKDIISCKDKSNFYLHTYIQAHSQAFSRLIPTDVAHSAKSESTKFPSVCSILFCNENIQFFFQLLWMLIVYIKLLI